MADNAITTDGVSIDLRSVDGSASQNEHAHIYEDETSVAHTLVTDDHAPVPIGEAATILDVPEAQVSWILTVERDGPDGVIPAAVPCATCAAPVWTTRERAERDRQEGWTTRCGSCAEVGDNA